MQLRRAERASAVLLDVPICRDDSCGSCRDSDRDRWCRRVAGGEALADRGRLAVELALQEAVANAIRHGCRGDVSKHVQCSVSCEESGEVAMVVRDPGAGFDPRAVADPLDAANLLKPSGRGIFLINELMDDVQFADGGREVQMRKKRAPAKPRPG